MFADNDTKSLHPTQNLTSAFAPLPPNTMLSIAAGMGMAFFHRIATCASTLCLGERGRANAEASFAPGCPRSKARQHSIACSDAKRHVASPAPSRKRWAWQLHRRSKANCDCKLAAHENGHGSREIMVAAWQPPPRVEDSW